MVPDLQKEARVQVKRSTEAVQYQPAGAFPVVATIGAGKGKRSIVFAYDGASPGDSSRHGVTNNV